MTAAPTTAGSSATAHAATGAEVRVTGLSKTYRLGRASVPVLRGVDLRVAPGEWVAILGASGSGKSTLLHLVGGLDRADKPNGSGESETSIEVDGREVTRMGRAALDRHRANAVGFVFQFYHLLPELSVAQNVLLGSMIRGGPQAPARERARELLSAFGLGDRLRHRPNELSGGERQRVAIARALINEPRVLLADEPTGNLDAETGGRILDVLAGLHRDRGLTTLMVTHDAAVAERADRIVRLENGVIEG